MTEKFLLGISSILIGISLCISAACQPKPQTSNSLDPKKEIVILDTDANNELDDQHAIAYLLFNQQTFKVAGITVNRTSSGGPLEDHYQEALRVGKLCQMNPQIPILKGADQSFGVIKSQLDDANFDGKEAVDFIIDQAHKSKEDPLVLIPVGKLTNIALAIAKDPGIIPNVRIVWLGSNYPAPGEYNQNNDTAALNYILDTEASFEIATVRYGDSTGTDAVKATFEEIQNKMPGMGPRIELPVSGRHGGQFHHFGDYSVNLFQHAEMHGDPPSRALFDMAAVAIVKNPSWARKTVIPAPKLVNDSWVDRPDNPHKIAIWESFDKIAIMQDFYHSMENYELGH